MELIDLKLIFKSHYGKEREIAKPKTYNEIFDEINKFLEECNAKRTDGTSFKMHYVKMHVHEQRCLCIDVGSWTEFFHAELEDGESWPDDFPESLLPKEE